MVEEDNTAVTQESIDEALLFIDSEIGSSRLKQKDKDYLLDRFHTAAARLRLELEND